ncbi:MAG: alpha/beta hydrolase [Vagococcus sp.]
MLSENLYIKNGSKAVLIMHAYTGSPNDVRMLSRSLEREGYSVYAPLFSGHGTTEPMNILTRTPEDWWNDAKDAVAFLKKEGFQQIAVFGLSMGGLFAMKLIEAFPEIFIGGGAFCSPIIPDDSHQIYPNFLKYCEFLFKKRGLTGTELDAELSLVKEPLKEQLTAIQRTTKEVSEKLEQIELPIFLAQSGQDEMVNAELVYEAGHKLKNSYHDIHWYPNSTHVITVSKDRQLFEKDVRLFVNKLAWNEE